MPAAPSRCSADGARSTFTIVPLTAEKPLRFTPSIEKLREIAKSDGGLDVHVTGTPAFASDFDTAVKSADVKLLLATGLLVLVLLLAVYRSVKLALIPLTNVALAYVVATGVIDLLARAGLSVDSTSTSLLPVLMFGAGTDYCLLLVARYRAALRDGASRDSAVASALPLAAPAMIASGLTVIAALVAMLAGVSGINRALGPVNAIGIAIVLVASLTLLPAMLAVLGPPKSWLAADDGVARRAAGAVGADRPAHPRARRPWLWSRVVAALVACTAGLGALRREREHPQRLPVVHRRDARAASRSLTAFPPGALGPTAVVVERLTALAPARRRRTRLGRRSVPCPGSRPSRR